MDSRTSLRSFARNVFLAFVAVILAACTGTGTDLARVAPPDAPITEKFAAIVVDAKTGKVIYDKFADEIRFPASLTKMMTLYLVFEGLEQGRLSRDMPLAFSENASRQPPSKIGVKPGESITVDEAIRALVVKSGNDAATAVAENLAGTESAFAARMTAKARQLGMKRTRFTNASGLPDSAMVTTARDMAILGLALRRDFPQYYGYFRMLQTQVAGKDFTGHNKALQMIRGADGIKTGYTRASGFNLVTSVTYNGRQVVAVVMGEKTAAIRDQRMASLVSQALPKASAR